MNVKDEAERYATQIARELAERDVPVTESTLRRWLAEAFVAGFETPRGWEPPVPPLDRMLLAMSTFYNGCDFTMLFDGARSFVEYGCECRMHLMQGERRRLALWIGEVGNCREVTGLVQPRTLLELKSRLPCRRCGGFRFRA